MSMSTIFMNIFNMSLTAAYCIAAVIILRFMLKRQPKIFSYLLWSVVLFRLLCPFSVPSKYSLLRMDTDVVSQERIAEKRGAAGTVWQGKTYLPTDNVQEAEGDGTNIVLTASVPEDTVWQDEAVRLQRIFAVSGWIWLVGAAMLIAYSVWSSLRFGLFLRQAEPVGDDLYETEGISTPFVFGVLNPRIYLPAHLQTEERSYVLEHERVHVARKDYLIKIMAWGAVCLHWFNPFVWLAFVLMERDMEMSCDEAVLRKMETDVREEYSRALLALSCAKVKIGGCPIAFGEGEVKGRIRNILSYRKRTFAAVALAVTLLLAVGVGLLLNPADKSGDQIEVTEEKIKFVTDYANTYCGRNGDMMVEFYIDESTAFEHVIMLEKAGGVYTFGYSSPWPDEFRVLLDEEVGKEEGKAEIWYYAWTSDPHVTVWKEEIEFTKTQDGYRVTDSAMKYLDSISSQEEFEEAYWIADGHYFTDYEERGFVEAINYQREYDRENGESDRNTVYSNPDTAAERIFNLTGGRCEVSSNSNGQSVIRYTFADGSSVMFPMMDVNFNGQTGNSADNPAAGDSETAVNEELWIPDLAVWNAGAP